MPLRRFLNQLVHANQLPDLPRLEFLKAGANVVLTRRPLRRSARTTEEARNDEPAARLIAGAPNSAASKPRRRNNSTL